MKEIQVFNHEMFGAIRTTTDEQGQPLFVGKDVAEALGYAKSRNALATHVDEDDKKDALIQGPLGGAHVTWGLQYIDTKVMKGTISAERKVMKDGKTKADVFSSFPQIFEGKVFLIPNFFVTLQSIKGEREGVPKDNLKCRPLDNPQPEC